MNVFSPFYFSKMNQIYYLCDSQSFSFNTNRLGSFTFASPSYYTEITEPLYDYNPPRSASTYHFSINIDKGTADWDAEIEKLSSQITLDKIIARKIENAVFLLFGPGWPESSNNITEPFYKRYSYYSHWIWCPMILILLLVAPFSKTPERYSLIIALTVAMIFLFIIQSSGVSEGRYRKTIEPLIITSLYLMAFCRGKNLSSRNYITSTISYFYNAGGF